MTSRTAAKRYARALFDVSLAEKGNLAEVGDRLADFSNLIGQHAALSKVLLNPAVPTPRKRAAVAELLKLAPVPVVLSKLLLLLAERDRLVILPDLVQEYAQRLLDHQNVLSAQVTTAAPLAPENAHAIEQRLTQATGQTVRLSAQVDASIIGGIITRIGGTVYDGSITGQLARMKKRLELA